MKRGRRRLAWLRGWLNRSSTMRQVPPSRWVNACKGTRYACIHVSTKGRWRRHRNGCIFALIKTAEPAEPYLWKVCVEGIDSKSGKRGIVVVAWERQRGKKRSRISPLVTSGNEGRSRSSPHTCLVSSWPWSLTPVLIPLKSYAMTNAFTLTAVRPRVAKNGCFGGL